MSPRRFDRENLAVVRRSSLWLDTYYLTALSQLMSARCMLEVIS
jgi:hypothetical protein